MNVRTHADTGVAIGDLVDAIASTLGRAGIQDPGAEARDLVAAVAGQNRFWPRLHADRIATPDVVQRAQAVATRRAAGMPFAYAVGRAAFRHLTLSVNASVLIPRQETELLVDLVLERRSNGGVVADVGTGSGAIALALATEGRFDRVLATDIAADAISVAKENARALRLNVEFRTGDLLAPLTGERLDVLVSNPPYIAFDEAGALPGLVRDWEPSHALFSGKNGLDATSRIASGAPELLCSGGLLALEVDCRRALQVAELVASNGAYSGVSVCQDLMGRDRFVLATRA
ncbi:MAG TPA: peptide chain release factor N(5)-glutamine methyltransferase [Gemmatimonadaceae bacterium]